MTRQLTHQPITKNVNDLLIGVPGFRVLEIVAGSAFTDTEADVAVSPLTESEHIGCLQQGTFSADATFKIHECGFPKLESARILEENNVVMSVVSEEIVSAAVLNLVSAAFERANGGSNRRFAAEMLFEKLNGGGVSFYCGNTNLSPDLAISSQDDWVGLQLDFEAVLNSTYTNQDLAYRANYTGASRLYLNQSHTKDPNAFVIGFAQVRMGSVTPRITVGGNGTITDPRLFPATGSATLSTEMTVNDGANYTGALDGAYLITITDTPYTVLGTLTGDTFDVSTGTGDNTVSFTLAGTAVAVTFTDDAALAIDTVVSEINSAITTAVAAATASVYTNPHGNKQVLVECTAGPGVTAETTVANTSLGFTVAIPVVADYFDVYNLDGSNTAQTVITGAGQAIEAAGLTVTFTKTVGYYFGDTFAVGISTGDAKGSIPAMSAVWSPKAYLSSTDSVGAVQAASFTITSSIKEHFSGYPKKKDAEISETVEMVLDVSLEEFTYASGALVKGLAATLADIVFDSSINGSLYWAPFEFVLETLNGEVATVWIPNANISGQLEVSPSDDWAAMPFQAVATKQPAATFHATAQSPDQIYLLTDDLA